LTDTKSPYRGFATFAAAGLELAGLALAFAVIGYGIDRWLDNSRLIGTGVAALVGFTLGMVRFVLLVNAANATRRPARKNE
jgi:hypothetical protein